MSQNITNLNTNNQDDYEIVKSSTGTFIRQPKNSASTPVPSVNETNTDGLDPKIKIRFYTNIYTKSQAIRRIRLLKDVINFKFFSPNDIKDDIKIIDEFKKTYLAEADAHKLSSNEGLGKYRMRVEDIQFLENLGKDFFDFFSPIDLDKQFTKFDKSLQNVPTYIIYVAIELPDEEVVRLGKWFKQTVSASSLIEINYKPDLIGGCAISSNGIYKDYSISDKIHDNKESIIEALTSYKHSTK